jgi:hypothetical protein
LFVAGDSYESAFTYYSVDEILLNYISHLKYLSIDILYFLIYSSISGLDFNITLINTVIPLALISDIDNIIKSGHLRGGSSWDLRRRA